MPKATEMETIKKQINYSKTGLYEYLLLAYPDQALTSKILLEKEMFAAKYVQPLTKVQPHITIANFVAREIMEDTIIRYSQRICTQNYSFKTSLNNYSGIPPHSIHLRIQDPQPFLHLANEFKVVANYIDSCSCPPVQLVVNPYISFASHLTETTYLQAISDYSQKTFHETFFVNALVLLRRSSEYDSCKTMQIFRFRPQKENLFACNLYN